MGALALSAGDTLPPTEPVDGFAVLRLTQGPQPVFLFPFSEGLGPALKNITYVLTDTLLVKHPRGFRRDERRFEPTGDIFETRADILAGGLLATLIGHNNGISISAHNEIGIVRHKDYLPFALLVLKIADKFSINRSAIKIIIRLVEKNWPLVVAQFEQDLEHDQRSLAGRHMFNTVALVLYLIVDENPVLEQRLHGHS